MKNVNSVLILGAGASQEFGYPLGDGLKDRVVSVLSSSAFQEELYNAYGFRPGVKDLIREFIISMKRDGSSTIDRFLLKSPKDYRWLGKVAIAKAIIDCEDHQKLLNNNSWYSLLYEIMDKHPNIEEFGSSNINIITFNYDRSLEHFLHERLFGDYDGSKNHDKILAKLKKIAIIHVHGRVNPLPREDSGKGLPYGSKGFVPNIIEIAENMMLPDDSTVSNDIHNLIRSADDIYFLGFGFHDSNLQKLDIKLISKCKHIFATSHNIPAAKQDIINDVFGQKKIKFYRSTVYDFFMDEFKPDKFSYIPDSLPIRYNARNFTGGSG